VVCFCNVSVELELAAAACVFVVCVCVCMCMGVYGASSCTDVWYMCVRIEAGSKSGALCVCCGRRVCVCVCVCGTAKF